MNKILNKNNRNTIKLNDINVDFTCNICGTHNSCFISSLKRENSNCKTCKSDIRVRSIIHLLSISLFNKSMLLKEWPITKNIMGIGLSDSEIYADILCEKLYYINTYYHKEPKIDITRISPKLFNTLDFIISTDVFEHVVDPVSKAFKNVFNMLKEDGIFIFSVPYGMQEETVEHFKDLYDYSLVEKNNEWKLLNTTADGVEECYDRLVFHGGEGSTVEMRIFSYNGVVSELKKAGFQDIQFMNDNTLYEHGIFWQEKQSIPVIAKKHGNLNVIKKSVSNNIGNSKVIKFIKKTSSIIILGWGPKRARANQTLPNILKDGSLGLWIQVEGDIELGKLVVLFDGQAMPTYISHNLITASISKEFFKVKGKKKVEIQQLSLEKSIHVGTFTIKC